MCVCVWAWVGGGGGGGVRRGEMRVCMQVSSVCVRDKGSSSLMFILRVWQININ